MPPISYSFNQSNELQCPPIPPKKTFLRRINSQPNVITENYQTSNKICIAPPRPTSKKPLWLQHLNPTQTQCNAYLLPNNNQKYYIDNQQRKKQCLKLSKNQSVSSNEIFKLYQTRDCLGNVLFEI